jgi:hypothetical protein
MTRAERIAEQERNMAERRLVAVVKEVIFHKNRRGQDGQPYRDPIDARLYERTDEVLRTLPEDERFSTDTVRRALAQMRD